MVSLVLVFSMIFTITACSSGSTNTNTGLSDPNPQIITENIETENIETETYDTFSIMNNSEKSSVKIDTTTSDTSISKVKMNSNIQQQKSSIPINQPNYIPGYYKSTVSNYLRKKFKGELQAFKASSGKKTGYSNLDTIIGYLYPGFYVLGAGSSIGKTTFVLQIADQMVDSYEPVIYFTLEQHKL